MANYIANTEQFTATADAIRAKTGSSADLEWDASTGYADDIAAIPTGTDTSDATATAGDILSGKTAYVDGSKVTGTIATKTASNLSASGKTVTVPAGYYASQATKDVASGSASTPATTITANPTITVSSEGLISASYSGSKSITPSVSAGYVSAGTAGTVSTSGSATKQLTTKAAATYNASTSDQTIAAGHYLTGAQTIRKITTSNITAANIKKGVVVKVGDSGSATRIKNVTGTYEGDTFAFITVGYPPGSTCTATDGTTTLTAPDTRGTVVFKIPTPASLPNSWTVSCTNGTSTISNTAVITKEGDGIEIILPGGVILESFATVSDTNFITMIQAAHDGKINLQTDAGWKVGDKRTISISTFTGAGSVLHAAQDIDIVISSFANYENCGCVLQFDFVDALAPGDYMNTTGTNTNGYGGSAMYKTTLPALVNALPAYLRGLLITFSCKASAGSKSTTIKTVTGNKLALRSEVEVFGTAATRSAAGEGSQIPYYTTLANRIKKLGHSGSADQWWERSPSANYNSSFCDVGSNGNPYYASANLAFGVAPFGCI